MDLVSGRPRVDREVTRRIRDWVRELQGVPQGATVSVQELRCSEAGCPDVETVVLVGLDPRRTVQHKIAKPASEVTREDLDAVLDPKEPR